MLMLIMNTINILIRLGTIKQKVGYIQMLKMVANLKEKNQQIKNIRQ